MQKIILILTVFFFTINSKAQEKIYLKENYSPTTKSKAVYYRIIEMDPLSKGYINRDFWIDGKLFKEAHFSSLNPEILDGVTKAYYKNGQLIYEVKYKNSKIFGDVIGYHESGQVKRQDSYINDSLIIGKCYATNGSDTIYYPFTKIPKYKFGGSTGFQKFISENLIYPEEAAEQGVQGRVYVYFCINSKGLMTDVSIEKSDNRLLNAEAKRVVLKTMNDWEVGYFEEKVAKIALLFPINFVLE